MKSSYFQNAASNYFVEVSYSKENYQIRMGELQHPCLVFELPITQDIYDRLPKVLDTLEENWKKIGYQKQTRTHEISEGSKASVLYTDDMKAHAVYQNFMKLPSVEYHTKEGNYRVFHFKNGLHFHANLDLAVFDEFKISVIGILVEGKTKIGGVLNLETDALFLGDVKAKSIIHENTHVKIEGNIVVAQTIFGYYNDGSLAITGDVRGEAWLSYDHNMYAEGKYLLFGRDTYEMGFDEQEWLNPKLLDFDRNLNTDLLRKFIYDGKSVLRKGSVFVPEIKSEEISSAEEVTETEASYYDPELLKQLEKFSVANDNEGMTNTLVNWHKRDAAWQELCESRLQAPSCSEAEKESIKTVLTEFKEGILKPTEENRNPSATESEPLKISEWSMPLSGQVCDELLVHPDIQKIIDAFGEEETTIKAFEKLPSQEILEAHTGWLYYQAMEGPPYGILLIIIEKLLELDLNPDVYIDLEEEYNTTNPIAHAIYVGHTGVLRRVFAKYPEIEEKYNQIAVEEKEVEKEKAEQNIPDAKELKQQKKWLKIVRKQNKLAFELQNKNPKEAITDYEAIIALCVPFLETTSDNRDEFMYNHMYAMQGKLWCLNDLVEKGETDLRKQAEAVAREILKLDTDGFYFSEGGALKRSAHILANNSIAWYTYEKGEALKTKGGNAVPVFESALPYSEAAIENIDGTYDTKGLGVVLETKTRLLFALGRTDEANELVFKANQNLKDYKYFKDLSKTEAFKKWDAEN